MRTLRRGWVVTIALGMSATACAPRLSVEQKRAITTRTIQAPTEMVFRATVTVLQDEGYSVTEADLETGLVSASVTKDSNQTIRTLAAISLGLQGLGLHWGDEPTKGEETELPERLDVDVTAVVTELDVDVSELRFSIQEVEHVTIHTVGKDEVEAEARPKTIYDLEAYDELFNAVRVEVERRRLIDPLQDGNGS